MEENKENRIMDKEILQSVKRFYSYLTNQELIEETEIEEEKNVAFCIHKIAVGYLALFSFGFFLLCLNQYANISFMLTAGIGGLAGIMVLLVFMLKIYKNGGFEKALEASGITSIQELMLGIGFGGVLSIVSLVIGLLLWKLPVLQEGPTFMKTVVIAITAVVYILIAIVAAVLNSIKEE